MPCIDKILDLYSSSGLNRPIADKERIERMYRNSNLIISAWVDEALVGIARSLTDFCYSCYLSDLAMRKEYQGQGIGKKLIELTQKMTSPQSWQITVRNPGNFARFADRLNLEGIA